MVKSHQHVRVNTSKSLVAACRHLLCTSKQRHLSLSPPTFTSAPCFMFPKRLGERVSVPRSEHIIQREAMS